MGEEKECPDCDGRGFTLIFGGMFGRRYCDRCNGIGKIKKEEDDSNKKKKSSWLGTFIGNGSGPLGWD